MENNLYRVTKIAPCGIDYCFLGGVDWDYADKLRSTALDEIFFERLYKGEKNIMNKYYSNDCFKSSIFSNYQFVRGSSLLLSINLWNVHLGLEMGLISFYGEGWETKNRDSLMLPNPGLGFENKVLYSVTNTEASEQAELMKELFLNWAEKA